MPTNKPAGSSRDASVHKIPAVGNQAWESKKSGVRLSSGSLLGGDSGSTVVCESFPVCEEIEVAVRGPLSDSDAASDTNTCGGGSSFFLGAYLSPVLEAQGTSSIRAITGYTAQHTQNVSDPGGNSGILAAPSIACHGPFAGHRRKVSLSGLGNACHSRSTSVGSLGHPYHSRNQSLGSLVECSANSMAEMVSRSGKESEGVFPFW